MAQYEFKLPSLGADMEEGILIEWKIAPGAHVKKGDIVAVIDTVKAAIDIEIFVDGIVEKILVQPDRDKKLPVGTPLAILEVDESALPKEPRAAPGISAQAGGAGSVTGRAEQAHITSFRASPAARRRAMELGVDLASVSGSGPSGEIGLADVERAGSAQTHPATTTGGFDRSVTMRKAIAAAMARSWREIPHYYVRTEVNMTAAVDRLTAENENRPVSERILMAALLLRAVALALKENPEFNGFYIEDEFRPGTGIHIGMAIALREGGLIAPAIRECDTKPLDAMMKALNDLVERTRNMNLRSSEMTDATITVTSMGDLGALTVFGIIYPPQVALVGFGSLQDRAVSVGDIQSAPMMDLTLSGDHRQTDGRQGAMFLATIKELLEQPEELFGE